MNPQIKAEWQRRLRSGEYDQGRDYLKRDGKHCCLGVLCEQAIEAGIVQSGRSVAYPPRDDVYDFDGETVLLPFAVAVWAGLVTEGQEQWDDDLAACGGYDLGFSLAEDNDDRGKSFEEIADIIEEEF